MHVRGSSPRGPPPGEQSRMWHTASTTPNASTCCCQPVNNLNDNRSLKERLAEKTVFGDGFPRQERQSGMKENILFVLEWNLVGQIQPRLTLQVVVTSNTEPSTGDEAFTNAVFTDKWQHWKSKLAKREARKLVLNTERVYKCVKVQL